MIDWTNFMIDWTNFMIDCTNFIKIDCNYKILWHKKWKLCYNSIKICLYINNFYDIVIILQKPEKTSFSIPDIPNLYILYPPNDHREKKSSTKKSGPEDPIMGVKTIDNWGWFLGGRGRSPKIQVVFGPNGPIETCRFFDQKLTIFSIKIDHFYDYNTKTRKPRTRIEGSLERFLTFL